MAYFFYLRMHRPQSNKSKSNRDYFKRYLQKNKDAPKKKGRERKKASREHQKYLCPQK